jgi:hypothetical protein
MRAPGTLACQLLHSWHLLKGIQLYSMAMC